MHSLPVPGVCVCSVSLSSVSLSVCQSVVCQSVSLSVCQSVSLSVCQFNVSLSVCQSVLCLFIYHSSVLLLVCLSVCLPVITNLRPACLSVCLSASRRRSSVSQSVKSVSQSGQPSVHLSVYLLSVLHPSSARPFARLPVTVSVCLFVCLSVVCLFILPAPACPHPSVCWVSQFGSVSLAVSQSASSGSLGSSSVSQSVIVIAKPSVCLSPLA
jgi:hypothetical protein